MLSPFISRHGSYTNTLIWSIKQLSSGSLHAHTNGRCDQQRYSKFLPREVSPRCRKWLVVRCRKMRRIRSPVCLINSDSSLLTPLPRCFSLSRYDASASLIKLSTSHERRHVVSSHGILSVWLILRYISLCIRCNCSKILLDAINRVSLSYFKSIIA